MYLSAENRKKVVGFALADAASAARAEELRTQGNDRAATEEWQKVFRKEFPAYGIDPSDPVCWRDSLHLKRFPKSSVALSLWPPSASGPSDQWAVAVLMSAPITRMNRIAAAVLRTGAG